MYSLQLANCTCPQKSPLADTESKTDVTVYSDRVEHNIIVLQNMI